MSDKRHQLSILDQWASQSGGTHWFGYKGPIGVDVGSKLIRQVSFTKASPHDPAQREELLSGDERAIFGDKAYPGKDLNVQSRQEGIYYGIVDKAYRNTPLRAPRKHVTTATGGCVATQNIPSGRSRIGMGWPPLPPKQK